MTATRSIPPWQVLYTKSADKALKKLGKKNSEAARLLVASLAEVAATGSPRSRGKPLTGNRSGLWRYRSGDYRVICEISEGELIILAIEVGIAARFTGE